MKRISLCLLLGLLLIGSAAFSQEAFTGPKIAAATKGLSALPNDAGQYWMVYDISPYTKLYPSLTAPQKAITSWILYDTGEDFWHGEPFGVFSADKEKISVYHNEKVQQYVSNVLDRFLDPAKKGELFSVIIVVVDSPDWRTRGAEWVRPYPVNTKGISGWTLDAAGYKSLVQSLSKRSDYVELNASRNIVPNTETFGWVLPSPTRNYVRDIQISAGTSSGYVADSTAIDEGYRIEITPLLSTNGDLIEFLFTCDSTAVEKMYPVSLKVPTSAAPRQQLTAEVPQIARYELKDKISFPKNQIFLLDLGMVPILLGTSNDAGLVGSIAKTFGGKSTYKNVLVFIQSAGTQSAVSN